MHPVDRVHLPAKGVSIGHLLMETAMIVFSVLLALSLESWREHRKQQALAHEALVNVRAELAHNIAAITAQLPRQRQVAEDLQAALRDLAAKQQPLPAQAPLNPPLLTAAAWQAAMTTQAVSHMDFRTVQKLASVYETQKWMDRIEDGWLRFVTAPHGGNPEAERQWLRSMQFVVLVYIETEQSLAAKAQQAISALPAD